MSLPPLEQMSTAPPSSQHDMPLGGGYSYGPLVGESTISGGNEVSQQKAPLQRKRKRNDDSPGCSCHQCKSRKPPTVIQFCRNVSENKNKSCRKKYCHHCLRKYYSENETTLSSPNWLCPSCRHACCCAACRRKDGKEPLAAIIPKQDRKLEAVAASEVTTFKKNGESAHSYIERLEKEIVYREMQIGKLESTIQDREAEFKELNGKYQEILSNHQNCVVPFHLLYNYTRWASGFPLVYVFEKILSDFKTLHESDSKNSPQYRKCDFVIDEKMKTADLFTHSIHKCALFGPREIRQLSKYIPEYFGSENTVYFPKYHPSFTLYDADGEMDFFKTLCEEANYSLQVLEKDDGQSFSQETKKAYFTKNVKK